MKEPEEATEDKKISLTDSTLNPNNNILEEDTCQLITREFLRQPVKNKYSQQNIRMVTFAKNKCSR